MSTAVKKPTKARAPKKGKTTPKKPVSPKKKTPSPRKNATKAEFYIVSLRKTADAKQKCDVDLVKLQKSKRADGEETRRYSLVTLHAKGGNGEFIKASKQVKPEVAQVFIDKGVKFAETTKAAKKKKTKAECEEDMETVEKKIARLEKKKARIVRACPKMAATGSPQGSPVKKERKPRAPRASPKGSPKKKKVTKKAKSPK